MPLDIHAIMNGLAERRPIFHSEADFQFALAWRIHKTLPDCEVRLEFKPFPYERMYLDVWLPTECVAIELKYLTRKLTIDVLAKSLSCEMGRGMWDDTIPSRTSSELKGWFQRHAQMLALS